MGFSSNILISRYRFMRNMHTISKRTCLAERSMLNMKELKLDLLPSNLYAAKRRAKQQKEKEKEKKQHEQQKNIVKIDEVSQRGDRIDGNEW